MNTNMTLEFENALDLIAELDKYFCDSQSLIVGGAVRDYLLGHAVNDIDIATSVPLEFIGMVFADVKPITKNIDNAQPVGIIYWKGFEYEIASFRSDSKTEGRRNNVSTIVSTFEEDSLRRDITINSMGMDKYKNIIDPQNGRQDLKDWTIRCCGDANERFAEDATRILRVIRFQEKFDFIMADETLDAIHANLFRLKDRNLISPESIAKEIFKVAKWGRHFARFLHGVEVNFPDILDIILPEYTALKGFTQDPKYHPEFDGNVQGHFRACLYESESVDPVTNIAIFCHDLGKAVTRGQKENGQYNYHGHEGAGVPIVKALFERLRFSELSASDKENILFCVGNHMLIHRLDALSNKTLCKLVHNPAWSMLVEVGLADEKARFFYSSASFNHHEFYKKINRAEEIVNNIAPSDEALRLKIKEHIDGNKVMNWFLVVADNPRLLKVILPAVKEHLINLFDNDISPTQSDVFHFVENIIKNLK